MNPTLHAALKLLVPDYYLHFVDGKLQVTNKFLREIAEIKPEELFPPEVKLPQKVTREVIAVSSKTKQIIQTEGTVMPFAKFINDCEVPSKIKNSEGGHYWANKYSKEAEKEFLKIITQGYDLEILINATKLYYKAGGFVEAVSNFIVRGTWLTHYTELKKQLDAGTGEKYVKDTIQSGPSASNSFNQR